ncbi:hypothetical protein [Micromonospora parva]|uniref:hypothetical protein n=1 Tax=Micromonospora parva TaxID=1464048 RepID=UPI0033F8B2C0
MTAERDTLPGPNHPLSGIATITFAASTGEVEVVLVGGRSFSGRVEPISGPTLVAKSVFDVHSSTLRTSLNDGTVFATQIGTLLTEVDRPVVYLDQNHWIDLARVIVNPPVDPNDREISCLRLIELARSRDIILPLSGGHVVEIAKKGGRQRLDVARVMVELSRGWQMRSPLYVRAAELARMFSPDAGGGALMDVFTLAPWALWDDPYRRSQRRSRAPELPPEVRGVSERISWIESFIHVLLDTDPEVSVAGLEMAGKWASSFQELAQHIRSNPKARVYARDLTRTRFITDMSNDVAAAAAGGGLTPEQFSEWLRDEAETAFSSLPELGRIREVLHLRLMNADDKWHRNDLNDVLFLCCAAGYADVVIGEKKMCSYLRRANDKVPAGAHVFRRVVDALPRVEAAVAARVPVR